MALIKCNECGKEISSNAITCPSCGYNQSKERKKKNLKKILIIFGVLLIIAGGIFTFLIIKRNKAINYKEDYIQNYKAIVKKIEDTTPKIMKCTSMYMNVWNNTIHHKSNEETDIYTKTNGAFNEDFNISLDALTKSKEYSLDIEEIEYQYALILVLMDDFKNPPKNYEEYHEELQELVDTFSKYANFIMKPSETTITSFMLKNIELSDDLIKSIDNISTDLD